ncbi:MAG: hypothetical protein ACI4XA_09935 [Oscillospiraceae bacterium]
MILNERKTETTEQFKSFTDDPLKRIKIVDFNTKPAKPADLTNNERRALLERFSCRKKRRDHTIMIIVGVFAAIAVGLIFAIMAGTNPGTRNYAPLMMILGALPGLCVAAYSIFRLSKMPNIEKSVIKTYEFTVSKIRLTTIVYSRHHSSVMDKSVDDLEALTRNSIQSIKHIEATSRCDTVIEVGFAGNLVRLTEHSSDFIANGIKVGDTIGCAVLEQGEYCRISLYAKK